jgi:hypothetical protein
MGRKYRVDFLLLPDYNFCRFKSGAGMSPGFVPDFLKPDIYPGNEVSSGLRVITVHLITFATEDVGIHPGIAFIHFIKQVVYQQVQYQLIEEFCFEGIINLQIVDKISIQTSVLI